MNLKTLWYFLWCMSSGGVSAGARQLGLAQSTLSGALGALEAELAVRLFEPTALGPRPTPAALRLRDYAAWLVIEAEQAFLDLQTGHVGSLEPMQVSTYGVPRCSVADWGIMCGILVSRSQGGPHAVVAASQADGRSPGDGIAVRYRVTGSGKAQTASQAGVCVEDRWVLVAHRGAVDARETVDWERLPVPRLIIPPLADADSASWPFRAETTPLDETGALYTLVDRLDTGLLLPSTMLSGGPRAPAVQIIPVTGAPIVPMVEIAGIGELTAGKRQLVHSIAGQMQHAVMAGGATPPRLKTLGANVDIHTLRCFAATMETGNTARAAQACFIVQPALSGQLGKLEKALSRQLFHRSHSGMTPTPAGRRLHTLVEPVLNDHATALDRLRDGRWSGRRRGRVRLGMIPAANEDSLIAEGAASALAAWRMEFPDMPISVAEGYTSVLLRWLRTHLIDVAIIDTTESQPGLHLTPIFREPITLVYAPGSQWDTAELPIEGATLAAGQLAIPSKRFGLRALVDRAFANVGVSIEPGLEVDSMAIALRLVRTGQWATILPPSALHRHLQEGNLRQRLLTAPSIDRRICAATRSGFHLPPETTSLLDKIAAAFRTHASNPEITFLRPGADTTLLLPRRGSRRAEEPLPARSRSTSS